MRKLTLNHVLFYLIIEMLDCWMIQLTSHWLVPVVSLSIESGLSMSKLASHWLVPVVSLSIEISRHVTTALCCRLGALFEQPQTLPVGKHRQRHFTVTRKNLLLLCLPSLIS
jgi:hypothetical protein